MAAPTQGTIEVAEKIASLIEKAPAGGIFHDVEIPVVAGIEVEGFGGFAGFEIRIPLPPSQRIGASGERVYEVAVQRVR